MNHALFEPGGKQVNNIPLRQCISAETFRWTEIIAFLTKKEEKKRSLNSYIILTNTTFSCRFNMPLNASLTSINTWQCNISIYISQWLQWNQNPGAATGNHSIISPSFLKNNVCNYFYESFILTFFFFFKLNSLKTTKSKFNIFLDYLSHLISRHISRYVNKISFYINLMYSWSNPKVSYWNIVLKNALSKFRRNQILNFPILRKTTEFIYL